MKNICLNLSFHDGVVGYLNILNILLSMNEWMYESMKYQGNRSSKCSCNFEAEVPE